MDCSFSEGDSHRKGEKRKKRKDPRSRKDRRQKKKKENAQQCDGVWIDLLHQYGSHIKSNRFIRVLGGAQVAWVWSDILTQYLHALLGPIFLKEEKDKDRCTVFWCNNDHLFPNKYTEKVSLCPKIMHKYWASAPWVSIQYGHNIGKKVYSQYHDFRPRCKKSTRIVTLLQPFWNHRI